MVGLLPLYLHEDHFRRALPALEELLARLAAARGVPPEPLLWLEVRCACMLRDLCIPPPPVLGCSSSRASSGCSVTCCASL